MKKILFLFLPILVASIILWMIARSHNSSPCDAALSRHAFDRSIGMRTFSKKFLLHRSLDRQLRQTAHRLINERKCEWTESSPSLIPQIIHQFWLSDEAIPDDLARATRLVQQQHPEFRYILWQYHDVKELLLTFLGPSHGSLPSAILRDIAAAVVLWNYGGVAVDLEAECVHPITSFLTLGDCLVGCEPPLSGAKWNRKLFVSPSVIAARSNHPIIQAYLAEMIRRIQSSEDKTAVDHRWVSVEALTSVLSTVGPEHGKPLLLGPTYFCPVNPSHIRHLKKVLDREVRRNSLQKVLRTLHLVSVPPYSDVARETLFVHMTGGRMSKQFGPGPLAGMKNAGEPMAAQTG